MQYPADEYETRRLRTLQSYSASGSASDSALDDLTMLAAELCNAPIALIALVDVDRIWVQSSVGISISDIPRENSFSHYAIQQTDLFVISDILQDERFKANPWWAIAPQIRFYAGIPLINPEGFALGTLNIMDYTPRTLTLRQQSCLAALGRQAMIQLELRRKLSDDDLPSILDYEVDSSESSPNSIQSKRFAEAIQQLQQLAHQNLALKSACAQSERATQMKSIFLATMSHEIRTPMNAVLGMVNLLSETELDTEQQEFVETIRVGGQSLLALINDILDFSRLEAGKTRLEMLEFNLHSCTDEVIDLLATTAYDKGLELAVLVDPVVPPYLRGDISRVRQVLINLVGNSIKFTTEGEVILSVDLHSETEQTVLLTFSVTDTGIGISQTSQAEIFQPFAQFNTIVGRTYGGSGLGLAICKELVELMGGTIGFESREGRGSRFWFTLTFEKITPKVGAEQGAVITNSIAAHNQALQNRRILVIDRKTVSYRVLQSYASLWNLQIDRVETVADALMILQQAQRWGCPYALVIVDATVPDAKTVARQLASDPQLHGIRSVLMASLTQRDTSKYYQQLGFSTYVLKPLKQSRLWNCLSAVLTNTVTAQQPSPSPSPSTEANTEIPRSNSQSAPYTVAPSIEPLSEPLSTVAHLSPTTRTKILVVEDTPLNQKVILKLLKRLNYDCDLVENGQAALDALEEHHYDIVLMDCQMPILDGYSATQQLRQREEQTRHSHPHHAVVIAMTANAVTGDRDKCLDAGMDDYLSKPIFKESLAEKLDYWSQKIRNGQVVPLPDDTEAGAPPSSPVTSGDFIQWQQLHRVAEGDGEFAIELVQLFLKGNQPNLGLAREAIANQDLAKVRHIAHQIKGSASNVGLTAIYHVADRLEQQVQSSSPEGMEVLVDELEGMFKQVQSLWLNMT